MICLLYTSIALFATNIQRKRFQSVFDFLFLMVQPTNIHTTIAANEMKSISIPILCDSTMMFELTQSERINIAISSPYFSHIFDHSKRINKYSPIYRIHYNRFIQKQNASYLSAETNK
ncbi:hypothetical protein PT2222_130242 [Paraburkholderia tropica]